MVLYYRCDECGHVWTIRKDAPDAPPHTVMKGIIPAPQKNHPANKE